MQPCKDKSLSIKKTQRTFFLLKHWHTEGSWFSRIMIILGFTPEVWLYSGIKLFDCRFSTTDMQVQELAILLDSSLSLKTNFTRQVWSDRASYITQWTRILRSIMCSLPGACRFSKFASNGRTKEGFGIPPTTRTGFFFEVNSKEPCDMEVTNNKLTNLYSDLRCRQFPATQAWWRPGWVLQRRD